MVENTTGAKSRNNMAGPKPKKHGWANAEKTLGDHIMNHHMVAVAEGGRHHVVKGGRRPPVIMWSPIVFSALAQPCFFSFGPYCFFGFGPAMFFRLWPLLYLGAGEGQNPIVCSASQYGMD